jgi:aspartokinase/homoserine dehydrogenase 1
MEKIKVMKIGGGCFTDQYALPQVLKVVENEMADGSKVIAVISAMGHTTSQLLQLAETNQPMMYETPDLRALDMLISTGETQSAALVANYLIRSGVWAQCFTGGQAGIVTDDNFGDANILGVDTGGLSKAFKKNDVAVVAGFQGQTKDGEITTLGRNGSDTTAFYLTDAFGAESCSLYKDVNGIYTDDPKKSQAVRHYKYLNFREVLDGNVSGIIHDKALKLCGGMFSRNQYLEIKIKNFNWPNSPWTTICGKRTEFYK